MTAQMSMRFVSVVLLLAVSVMAEASDDLFDVLAARNKRTLSSTEGKDYAGEAALIVYEHFGFLNECFSAKHGKIEIKLLFEVLPGGHVGVAAVKPDTPEGICVLEQLRTLTFPPPPPDFVGLAGWGGNN